MSHKQFLRSAVLGIVAMAIGLFILVWLVFACFGVEASALWPMGGMVVVSLLVAQVLMLLSIPEPRQVNNGTAHDEVEDRPADRTDIKVEAPGPASTSMREGHRWRWRRDY